MSVQPLIAYAKEQGIVYLAEEPMKNHTSFRIGGPAEVIVYPKTQDQCAAIIRLCKSVGLPLFVLGKGSNLLVSDRGLRGAVLCTDLMCTLAVEDGACVRAGAGASLRDAALFALQNGLSGLEFAHGIPGSVGGAVYMNAGAYGGEMSAIVRATAYIDESGEPRVAQGDGHAFGYRRSVFSGRACLITETVVSLSPGRREDIAARVTELLRRRSEKQPLDLPSAGSVFKRPPGHFAGKLISDCGLGGYTIGGAQVSEKHCGFIVNRGGATAKDVLMLIEHIKETVRERFGVELECEIKLVGEP